MDALGDIRDCLALRRNLLRTSYGVSALLLLAAPIATAVSLDVRMLALWLGLPCVFAGTLLADALVLARWRHRRLDIWKRGGCNLAVTANALANLPNLPRASLAAMLRSLPVLTPLQDRDLDPARRTALAAFSDWRWTEETAAALLPGAILALLSGTAAVLLLARACDVRSAAVLFALLAGLLLIRFGAARWRRGRLAAAIAALDADAVRALPDLVASLDWSTTPDARRRTMLRILGRFVAR